MKAGQGACSEELKHFFIQTVESVGPLLIHAGAAGRIPEAYSKCQSVT